jgi:hypothetical protein
MRPCWRNRGTRWQCLRYLAQMKKPTITLALRKETLRTLAKVDLARAVGGNDGLAPQTNRVVCTVQDAVATATPPA